MKTSTQIFISIFALLAMIGLFALCANSFATPEPIGYVRVTVQRGDSLWSIGSENCNKWNELDNQDIIKVMQERSNCSSTIYPGQTIYVPIYED